MNGIYGWLAEASGEQKRTLLAAFLGYMLDSMDVMLYALVLGQVQRELHLSAGMSGAMVSATLIAAAAGGIGFGWFADRFGRVRALIWSVLVYSIGTGLCGFTQTATQLMLCRVLLGFGMGGEWASGAALVAETWPARHRGKALALVQSAWAIGYALGAACGRAGDAALRMAGRFLRRNSSCLDFPLGAAWAARTGGLAPGTEVASGHRPPLSGHVRLQHAGVRQHECRRALRLVGTVYLAPSFSFHAGRRGWPWSQHYPNLWMDDRHADRHVPGLSLIWILADRFSRKYTYIGYLVVAALLVPPFAFVRNPNALLLIGPLVGFFGTGYFSGFGVIASELFPTALRASAMGFAYNIGRVLSAAAPYLIGRVSEQVGLSWALCITSAAFLLAAVIATALRPPATQVLT